MNVVELRNALAELVGQGLGGLEVLDAGGVEIEVVERVDDHEYGDHVVVMGEIN